MNCMPESERELLPGAQSPEQAIREESQGRCGYEASHLWDADVDIHWVM